MKLVQGKEQHSKSVRSRFAVVAVMSAGLSIMPCCATGPDRCSDTHVQAQAQTSAAPEQQPASPGAPGPVQDAEDRAYLVGLLWQYARENALSIDMSKVRVLTQSQSVMLGDEVRGGIFDNTSVPLRVSKIDEAGIEIGDGFMRFEFGKRAVIGEFMLRAVIRAEKGQDGAVVLTNTMIDPQSLGDAPAAPRPTWYKVSGPAQR